jgi:hypothetical protein
VAGVVVAVTFAWTVVDPSRVIMPGFTVQVANGGAPLQLSDINARLPLGRYPQNGSTSRRLPGVTNVTWHTHVHVPTQDLIRDTRICHLLCQAF